MTPTTNRPRLHHAFRSMLAGVALALTALAVLPPSQAVAAQVTLDFSELADGTPPIGNSYERSGFQLSTDSDFGFWLFSNGDSWYVGSKSLFSAGASLGQASTLRLQRSDGGLFDFNGLSLAGLGMGGDPQGITFNAYDAAGLLLDSYTVDASRIGLTHFESIDFGKHFLGVSRVTWQQSQVAFQAHQIDNLLLDQPTAAVPEPSTLLLAACSLFVLGITRRRWQ